MRYDRDELLARTDLAALADDLLGGHKGNGRGARWSSPVPSHPQTGRTPPMSIFTDRRGVERWTCFATGACGTAIDLVTTVTGCTIAEAMTWLAERARLRPNLNHGVPGVWRAAPPQRQTSAQVGPSRALREYVEACERILWQPEGAEIRRWLVDERQLEPDVLRRNGIGADPGPSRLRRARGLPWRGPAAVFPALATDGGPAYLQARYLRPPPGRGKYDNPSSEHGSNPRMAPIEPVGGSRGPTIVTEGIPDALAAACGGYRAVAVLGTGLPNDAVAQRLQRMPGPLVLMFDADCAGRSGSDRLCKLLGHAGRADVLKIEPPAQDLNTWLVTRGRAAFTQQMQMLIGLARPGSGRSRSIA